MDDLKEEIKNFCEAHGIKTKINIKKLEIAYDHGLHSTICYYRIRKGLTIYIDYDFPGYMSNEMSLMKDI